jgi:hypothetical protein
MVMNTSIAHKKAGNGIRENQKLIRPAGYSLRKVLLFCGILSSLWYVAINFYVPRFFPGYNAASQTVSELSAIGAPTRLLWNSLAISYTLMVTAFGFGVWKSAGINKRLRITGVLLLIYGAMGVLWPFAPMHLRETLAAGGGNWSDTLHIGLAIVTEVIYLFALGFAATALGKRFRLYSILTFIVLLVFGALTFKDAPHISTNQPTPWIGIWERINIGVFLLWMIVLSSLLLPSNKH